MDPPFFSPPLPLPRSSTPSPWEEATRRRRRRRKKGKREEESERGEGKIRQERDFEGEYERNCHIWGHTSLDETWMKKKETISLFELVQFSISFPYPSFTFVLIQSHSLHAIYPIFPFLFPLILEQGKPSSDRIVHARADQSHLLRRSVTEHVTSVHLVRVPTASRCQPRRSGTGRDACPLPPLLLSLYPNETKRSDRTGRALETHPPSSPTQSRASTKLLLLITLTLYIIHFFLSPFLPFPRFLQFLLARRKNSSR